MKIIANYHADSELEKLFQSRDWLGSDGSWEFVPVSVVKNETSS